MTTILEYFWKRVDKRNEDECWPWIGQLSEKGYGRFRHWGRETKAHRVAYEIAHDVNLIPEVEVLHTCDNPPCCNPKHLIAGNNNENRQDSVRKRRHAFGERHGMSKLGEDIIPEIRRLVDAGVKYKIIARQYKISIQTVCDIHKRRSWTHL